MEGGNREERVLSQAVPANGKKRTELNREAQLLFLGGVLLEAPGMEDRLCLLPAENLTGGPGRAFNTYSSLLRKERDSG